MSSYRLVGVLALALAAVSGTLSRSRVRAPRPSEVNPLLRDYGNTEVWPIPDNATNVCFGTLDPSSFALIAAQPAGDAFLAELIARFTPQILYYPGGIASPSRMRLANVSLFVLNPSVRQVQQGVDESYELSWAADCSSAKITGATVFGVRHGLEVRAPCAGRGGAGRGGVGALERARAARGPLDQLEGRPSGPTSHTNTHTHSHTHTHTPAPPLVSPSLSPHTHTPSTTHPAHPRRCPS